MREIKFRAWSKLNKQMYPDNLCTFAINPDGKVSQTWGIYTHDLVLMQYTGLKDKNGVEAFHKDIVEGHSRWLIEWDENEGNYYLKSLVGYDKFPLRKLTGMSIIGNIYETRNY